MIPASDIASSFSSPDGAMMVPDRSVEPRGPWIQVFSGGRFYPFDPRPDEVKIDDIAHALSQQTRFTGHLRQFWSVAQHSVEVSKLVPPEYALWGLLHDASEAYVTDISRPIKHDPRMSFYRDLEKNIMRVVAMEFCLPWPEPPEVSLADKRQLGREARDLMGPRLPPSIYSVRNGLPLGTLQPGWEQWIEMAKGLRRIYGSEAMPPNEAEGLFLDRYAEIIRVMPNMQSPAA